MGSHDARNARIEEVLRERGDDLSAARPVDHWAYFPTREGCARFVASLGLRFEAIRTLDSAELRPNTYGVRFTHVGLPDAESMTRMTQLLERQAAACGGEYDGWETQVLVNEAKDDA